VKLNAPPSINRPVAPDSWTAPPVWMRLSIAVLALIGLSISVYLSWIAFSGDQVAGCGESGLIDCDKVLQSRWSTWRGLPVAFLAVTLYTTLLVALPFVGSKISAELGRISWNLTAVLGVTASLAAIWFIGLQVFLLQSFCLYCLAAHCCAIVIGGIVLLGDRASSPKSSLNRGMAIIGGSLVAVAVLAGGQVLTAPPKTYQLESFADTTNETLDGTAIRANDSDPAVTSDESPPVKTSRLITVLGRRATIDVYEQPMIGSPDAKHLVVKLFDYSCPHCRELHKHMVTARDRYGDELAFVMMPVPLDGACNPSIKKTPPKHIDACKLAKLALAVFHADASKFEQFDTWLNEHEEKAADPVEARQLAEKLVGADELAEWLGNEVIKKHIDFNLQLYDKSRRGKIPKLLFRHFVIAGKISDLDLSEKLENQFNIKPLNP